MLLGELGDRHELPMNMIAGRSRARLSKHRPEPTERCKQERSYGMVNLRASAGGGFVQRGPEGWIFTISRSSYLVNEGQKAELLARLDRWRVVWFVLFAAILAPVVAISENLSRVGIPDWIHLTVTAAIFGFPAFFLVAVAIPYFQLLLVRPILTGLLPATSASTPARISFCDRLFVDCRRQARTYSLPYLVFACLFLGLISIASGYKALAGEGDYFLSVAMIYFTANFGVLLFLKLRARRSSE
jgi:hypothetical protein